ncbi:MAG: sulfurtransferase TusA family protein [Proteobacteria bacterium]|nr:sulfurtransferase TusA family protein [Pseudomonadota bacterium]
MESEKTTNIFDLRGVACPLNYVKAKLRLEEMNIDEILILYLDEGEPIQNVPLSLKEDGQEILSIENEGNYYLVRVKKKV